MTATSEPLHADMTEQKSDRLNNLELTSIYALLAYTAYDKHISEDTVRETVTTKFGVPDVKQLPRQSYEEVIRFLVDMQVDLIMN